MVYNTPTVTELEVQNILNLWDKLSKENVKVYPSVGVLNKVYNDFLTELGLGLVYNTQTLVYYKQTPYSIRFPVIVDKKKWFLNKLKYGI
jgi:L-ribulose-5-phosphate 3-epimerase UlaE